MMDLLESPFLIGFKVEGDVPKAEYMGLSIRLCWHEKRIPFSL